MREQGLSFGVVRGERRTLRLRKELAETNWDSILELGADGAAELVTERLLAALEKHVPSKKLQERKGTHPWLTDEVLELVRKKRDAEGTEAETQAAEACSDALLKAYKAWVQRTREELASLQRGSKKW